MFSVIRKRYACLALVIFLLCSSSVYGLSFDMLFPSIIRPGQTVALSVAKLPNLKKVYVKFNNNDAVKLDHSFSSKRFMGVISIPENEAHLDSRFYVTGFFADGSIMRDYYSVSLAPVAPVPVPVSSSVQPEKSAVPSLMLKSCVFLLGILILVKLLQVFIKHWFQLFPTTSHALKLITKPICICFEALFIGVSWTVFYIKQFPLQAVSSFFRITIGIAVFSGVCLVGGLLGIYLFLFLF
ncbi:hypothetical protein OAJ27_01725 [bacterium]|nr:hypothetical protein [bacterium]